MKQTYTPVSALASVGAVVGIYYGVSKRKSFWVTAGFTILFSVGGAALGATYQSITK